ncbi:hypothetical protein Dcar01_00864 [Deinococcus carri]|uniref:Uncharacterized protein n=1 Tax=Deinococcus carri TaxID=1211323 RepID=A0ABP9W6Q0_9DEIO
MFDPRLIRNLRRFSSQVEAAAYLDLVAGLLTGLELAGDDLRFHFNPTSNGKYFLPLTINNRYIVMKGRDVEGGPTWWLIHPGPPFILDMEADEILASLPFAHKRHDAPEAAPMLAQYRAAFVRQNLGELLPRVLALAARDLASCRVTPCRASHSPLAYALALDDAARGEVLPGIAFTGFAHRTGRGERR